MANFETEKRFISFVKSNFKAGWMGNLSISLEGLVNSLSNVIILWIGGMEVIKRNISIGQHMLILDEATSSLDSATEKAIHNTIDYISRDITTLIIAHRLSTIKNCDRIIIMDKGEIVENGSHEELLDKKGRYYDLWESQVN